LFSIIEDLQTDPLDLGPEAILSYAKLNDIIDIYSKSPVVDWCDSNHSYGFKRAIDINRTFDEIKGQGWPEILMKFVH